MRNQATKNQQDKQPLIFEMLEDYDEDGNFDNLELFPSAIMYREYLKEKRVRDAKQKAEDDEAQKQKELKEKAIRIKKMLKGNLAFNLPGKLGANKPPASPSKNDNLKSMLSGKMGSTLKTSTSQQLLKPQPSALGSLFAKSNKATESPSAV